MSAAAPAKKEGLAALPGRMVISAMVRVIIPRSMIICGLTSGSDYSPAPTIEVLATDCTAGALSAEAFSDPYRHALNTHDLSHSTPLFQGGSVAATFCHPLDTLKVQMQVGPRRPAQCTHTFELGCAWSRKLWAKKSVFGANRNRTSDLTRGNVAPPLI